MIHAHTSFRHQLAPTLGSGGAQQRGPMPQVPPVDPVDILDQLIAIGQANDRGRWHMDRDISLARNAHFTNTTAQLRGALAGPFDWLECDVRLRGASVVTAHGRGDGGALKLRDWLRVAAATQRGAKLDIKDAAAIPTVLQLVRASGIDPRRIIINVRAGTSMQGNQASLQQLRHIRAVLPTCVINIDPGPAPYERRRLERAVQIARAVGGRVMFPLDAQHVTPEAVRLLRAVGRVAIWNNPDRFDPGSIAAATAWLRSIGVDGMIDLRRPNIGSRRRWNGASI